jgi:hypothetical protein
MWGGGEGPAATHNIDTIFVACACKQRLDLTRIHYVRKLSRRTLSTQRKKKKKKKVILFFVCSRHPGHALNTPPRPDRRAPCPHDRPPTRPHARLARRTRGDAPPRCTGRRCFRNLLRRRSGHVLLSGEQKKKNILKKKKKKKFPNRTKKKKKKNKKKKKKKRKKNSTDKTLERMCHLDRILKITSTAYE